MLLQRFGFCLVVLLLLCQACPTLPGSASVVGWVVLEECGPEQTFVRRCSQDSSETECSAFDLGVDFYALELFDERSGKVRLQRGGAGLHLADALVLEFRDIRTLRGRLGESLLIGASQSIRAALILGSTCPDSTESLVLTGQVVMSHFGTEVGDRIAGRIEFLEVRDGREQVPDLIGVLRGEFDFRYRKGTPFEQFYR